MSGATEVGVAYVRLLPSMDGFAGEVKSALGADLTKAARAAADDAGRVIGKELEKGIASADLEGATSKATSGIADGFKVAAAGAGLAGGALLAKGLTDAMDVEGVQAKLEAQLGSTEWAADAAKVAGKLYGDNFGESVADAADAIRKVLSNGLLDEGATDDEIKRVTGQFLTFTDVLEQDMDMTTQAVKSMITSGLVDSTEEALDVMTRGIVAGGDKAGDFAETFQEYSTKFRDLGLSAADAAGLMAQGIGAGARDADIVADALKEFSIRAIDGSNTSFNAFRSIGLDYDNFADRISKGGSSARQALAETLDALRRTEDPITRNAAAVGIFGTQAEDLGDALFALDLNTATDRFGELAGATDGLGSAYDTASSKIEGFKRKGLMALTNFVGGTALPAFEKFLDVIGPGVTAVFDGLAPIIQEVAGGFTAFFSAWSAGDGDVTSSGFPGTMEKLANAFRDVLDQAAPVFDALRQGWQAFSGLLEQHGEIVLGIVGALAVAIGAGLAVAIGSLVASAVAAAAPFIAAGAAIAAIGAGIMWLYNNVAGFKTFVDTALPLLGQLFSAAFDLIKTVVVEAVRIALAAWDMFGGTILAITSAVFGTLGGVILGALDIVVGIIRTVTALIHGDWGAAWDGIKQILSGALGIVVALVKGTFEVLWALVGGGVGKVVDFFTALPGQLVKALGSLADVLTKPFREAFDGIRSLWNKTVGGFSFKVPDWIPGVGGKGFSIPKMHTGGIFDAPGGEGLALLKRGEGVFTPEQMAALGRPTAGRAAAPAVVLHADGLDRTLLEWLRRSIRVQGGGNVQMALGSA